MDLVHGSKIDLDGSRLGIGVSCSMRGCHKNYIGKDHFGNTMQHGVI